MRVPTSDLRTAIFGTLHGTPGGALEGQFMEWASSPRFRAFADAYRDKVRKKLRLVPDEEGLRDLQLELEVAVRLLRDRRFTVEYERHAADGRRHPDLTVTFRTRTLLHLEVKRMRAPGPDLEEKCSEVICGAVSQLLPSALNALAIGLPHDPASRLDPAEALRTLRERAERKDEEYFRRRGFADARDFLRSYRRLSALLIDGGPQAALVVPNPLARHALPDELSRALAEGLVRSRGWTSSDA